MPKLPGLKPPRPETAKLREIQIQNVNLLDKRYT